MLAALGIDIGGTNGKLGLVTQNGEVVETRRFSTRDCIEYSSFLSQLEKNALALIEEAKSRGLTFKGVGIGVPNYNPKSGYLVSPPNLKWGSPFFLDDMKNIFSQYGEVTVENDANVAAIGEGSFGEAVGINDYIVVTVGTGIGTGIVVNSQVVHGDTGIGGEGGHLCIVPDGRECGCGGLGHFEAYCSVTGMKKTFEEMYGEEIQYRELAPLFIKDEPNAVKVFETSARYMGIALSNLAVLFSPKKIILAGGGMMVGERFLEMIQSQFNQYVYPPLKGKVEITLSRKEVLNGAILGASSLIL